VFLSVLKPDLILQIQCNTRHITAKNTTNFGGGQKQFCIITVRDAAHFHFKTRRFFNQKQFESRHIHF